MKNEMVDELKREGIFVVHALNGYEYHEERIKKLFGENNLNFEFVTDGDPSLFTDAILEKYFVPNIQSILPKGVLSCTLNHIHAYERIVQRGIKYAIVFENDPFFLGDFTEKLRKAAQEIENLEKGYIVSLENSTLKFPSYWETEKGKHLYGAKSGRMAGAYLIDLAGATRILDDLNQTKCHTVIDWWHNSLIDRGVVTMYWMHPPLVEQGSHNGRMSSTISSKPANVTRSVAWLAQKLYKSYFRRLFKQKETL